jgi:preprotein translocase subunit SecD
VIVSIVEHRLTSLGLAGSTVRAMAADRFLVELSTTMDTQAARDLIGQTGHLDFVPLGTTQMQVGDVVDPAKFPALFSGDQVETAATENDPTKGRIVTFVLKSEGATLFGDYTAGHVGQYFAIALDSKVISAPTINQAIPGGHVEISSGGIGGYPLKEAQDLVAILQFGELPFPIVELSNEVVSPGPITP